MTPTTVGWTSLSVIVIVIVIVSAGLVANVIGVKKPPWMEMETLAQERSPLDREVQRECCDRHQRTRGQLGRSCCQNGRGRDLREGLEVSRTSVVEMATVPLERNGEGEVVWRAPRTRPHTPALAFFCPREERCVLSARAIATVIRSCRNMERSRRSLRRCTGPSHNTGDAQGKVCTLEIDACCCCCCCYGNDVHVCVCPQRSGPERSKTSH